MDDKTNLTVRFYALPKQPDVQAPRPSCAGQDVSDEVKMFRVDYSRFGQGELFIKARSAKEAEEISFGVSNATLERMTDYKGGYQVESVEEVGTIQEETDLDLKT